MIKKILKWSLITLAVAFVVIQFVRPAKTNPPVDSSHTMKARTGMTAQVEAIFERSCKDCHSNETAWPWYSHLAPVSWLLVDDVNEGRKEFNASEWAKYDSEDAEELLKDICKEVKEGKMPLSNYTRIHPSAKLSPEDVSALCEWATAERHRLAQKRNGEARQN